MPRPVPTTRPDLHARVTDAILADLERGVRPWTRPWSVAGGGPVSRPLRHTGEPYSGVNVLLLWASAVERGFGSPTWMTFRQALALGACVRKGEKGATVAYADRIVRAGSEADGEDAVREIAFLKAYTVFNLDQIDGLPERFQPVAGPALSGEQRIAGAEAFFAAVGAAVRHGGGRAFYAPGADVVQLPAFEAFHDAQAYYATLAHECVHWTGHPSRLDRAFKGQRFGEAAYAREELVAELGAAFLCADLGIALQPREDHAAYVASWLDVLKGDRRAVFSAAAHAQRAVDYLHGLQPEARAAP